MCLSCWAWQNDNHFRKLLGQKMVDAIKHFLFLGFSMAISHKLFWFIVFPKSFLGSLHSHRPLPVQWMAMGNTPRNSHWEHGEAKRLPLTVEIFFFCILSSEGGLFGLVGWEKKPAYNEDVLESVPGNPCAPWKWAFQHWCNSTNIRIAKFKHENKESLSSTMFWPSNFPTWLSFRLGPLTHTRYVPKVDPSIFGEQSVMLCFGPDVLW